MPHWTQDSESEVGAGPLSKDFFDDVWGTSKSLPSLQSHPDFKRWLAVEGLTAEDHRLVESRLQCYRVSNAAERKVLRMSRMHKPCMELQSGPNVGTTEAGSPGLLVARERTY